MVGRPSRYPGRSQSSSGVNRWSVAPLAEVLSEQAKDRSTRHADRGPFLIEAEGEKYKYVQNLWSLPYRA